MTVCLPSRRSFYSGVWCLTDSPHPSTEYTSGDLVRINVFNIILWSYNNPENPTPANSTKGDSISARAAFRYYQEILILTSCQPQVFHNPDKTY